MSTIWIEDCYILASRGAVVELRKEFRKELDGYIFNCLRTKIEMYLSNENGLLLIKFYNLGDSLNNRYARAVGHDYKKQMRRMAKLFGGKVAMSWNGEDYTEVYRGDEINWSHEDLQDMNRILSMTNESFSAFVEEAEKLRIEEARERGRRLQNRM